MSRDEASSWIDAIDPAFVERRFGAGEVDRRLARSELAYVPPWPRVDAAGRLSVTFTTRGAAPSKLAVRVQGDAIEKTCACSPSKGHLCAHVVDVLIDLACFPDVRAAIRAGEPLDDAIAGLDERRRAHLEERTLDERIARWLPERAFEDDLELDVTVAPSTGMPSADPRPAVFLRHRRLPTRTLARPRDVLAARLPPRRRRLVELTTPSSAHRDALVATNAQASLLVELLRRESPVFTRGFRERLRFSSEAVRPHVVHEDGRLVARWHTDQGLLCAALQALLFVGPFPFVWSTEHEVFHPVATDVDLDAAWGLSFVPSLPFRESTSPRILPALLERGRDLGVVWPSPASLGVAPQEAPEFTLRVHGSLLDVQAELVARYRDHTVIVDPNTACPSAFRDEVAERKAIALLREAGLLAEGATEGAASDEASEETSTEERAVDFWRRGLALLEVSTDPRVAVHVDAGLVRGRVVAPIDARVDASAASGWLEMELTFTAGALKVEMATIRKALRERRRWLALDDGTLTKITDAVAELVGDVSRVVGEGSSPRIAMHHLAEVRSWVEAHGGHFDASAARLVERLASRDARGEPRLPTDLRATLRPYQRDGVAWLETLREAGAGGILADDMGLGKTLMTLTLLARWKEDEGPKPSLVVCPTSLLGNWKREAEKFTSLSVRVAHASAKERAADEGDVDLVVTTYGLLRRDVGRLANTSFRAVVLDEAQNIKNEGAHTTRAARRLRADLRLALTGTPVENRVRELWSLATFANPGILGSARDFRQRFEEPIALSPDGATAAHLRGIVRPFVLRRTKREVLADLPPKIEIERSCVPSDREKRLYDALARTLRQSVKKNIEKRGLAGSRIAVLTAILRLRQMACDPRLVDPASLAPPSAKREAFLDLAREIAFSGRKALVFSQFVELLTLWRQDLDRAGIAYEYLDGSSVQRDAIVDRFQGGPAPLFLVSLKAGGAGLNLTAADTVVHCDPWWNPAAEDQATDRAHRIGQTRAVTVVRLHAQGTIEDKIALLKERKRRLVSAVVDGAPKTARVIGGDGPDEGDAFADDLADDEGLALLEERDEHADE